MDDDRLTPVPVPGRPAAVLSQLLGDTVPGPPPDPREGRRSADRDFAFASAAITQLVEEVVDYAVLILDTGGHVSSWNRGAERIKGYTAADILGHHFSIFYPAEDVAAGLCSELLRTAELEGRVEHEGWRVRRDGARFWADVVITALRSADGRLIGFGKVTRDLTERRRHEQHLEHLATHDALSDLPSRRALLTALTRSASSPAPTSAALLLVDLDHFKLVNDTLGHAAGDRLIRATAGLLHRVLVGVDGLPARIGGDEFAILLFRSELREAVALAHTLVGAVRAWGEQTHGRDGPTVSATVGVCPITPGMTADDALAAADHALYEAKRRGRAGVGVAEAGPPR